MTRKKLPPAALLFPTPVVLVTSVDQAGNPNIITLAWAGVVNSDPPMVSISIRPHRHSNPLVKSAKEFVVNIPSREMLRKVDACGVISGRNVKKFSEMGWHPVPAEKVKPPLIDECSVQLECQVKEVLSLGTHDLFIGLVVAVHAREEILDAKGNVDISKCLPFVYCPGAKEYWNLGQCIGEHGFTKGKP